MNIPSMFKTEKDTLFQNLESYKTLQNSSSVVG